MKIQVFSHLKSKNNLKNLGKKSLELIELKLSQKKGGKKGLNPN